MDVSLADPTKHEQFVELLTRHQGHVFSYIYAMVRNFNDAEDVFQQTCLVLGNKLYQFQQGSNFVHWACSIAKFEVLNFIRKQQRRQLYFSPEFVAELAQLQADMEADADADRQVALASCIEQLATQDQELVRLCYGDDRGFKQVAADLGRPVQNIYDALSRIRKSLLQCVHRKLAMEEHP